MTISMLALFFSAFNDFDYDKAWKEVDALIEKGLPKSALDKVTIIYDQAIKDDNIPQQIKALTRKVNLVFFTEELGLETVVEMLEESIEKAESPAKQILHSLSAELFTDYFTSQYYKISQRTNSNAIDLKDIRTWTPTNFRSYIEKHYHASVNPSLSDYKSADFKAIISNYSSADISLRPSLYELLLDRALSYFANKGMQGTQPSFAFKLDDAIYYAPVEDFVSHQFSTQDSTAKSYQTLLLYQEALQRQLDNNNRQVLAAYDLMRLQFVNNNAEIPNKSQLYLEALDAAIKYYSESTAHPFQIEKGILLNSQKKYEEAIKIFEQILQEKPKKHIKQEAENWIASINIKDLRLTTEQVIPIAENFLLHISSRNVNTAYLKIVDASKVKFSEIFQGNQNKQQKKIETLPVIREWQISELQDGYNPTQTEEIVNGLPNGKYLIIASDQANFKSSISAYVFSGFYVSDIAFSTYQNLEGKFMSVRDRKSGKPIAGAKVQLYTRVYNRNTRTSDMELISTQNTDPSGMIQINAKPNNSISYTITHNKDLLNFEELDYLNRINKPTYPAKRIEVFMDRAIYRPGQTAHFKVLSMKINDDGIPSIAPNSKMTIELKDANGEVVESISQTTNEFGSASGSFTLPTGRLTGQYSLLISESQVRKYHFFQVEEYKRPQFEAKIDDVNEEVKIGDTIQISGKANALSGAPITDGNVSYVITRSTYLGWWGWYRRIPSQSTQVARGQLTTDAQGNFTFDFNAVADADIDIKENPNYTYNIEVEVTATSGETRFANKTISVAAFPYGYEWELGEVMDITDLKSITIQPTTTEGTAISGKGTLIISELVQPDQWMKPRIWSQPDTLRYSKAEYQQKLPRVAHQNSKLSEYPVRKEVLRAEVEFATDGLVYDFTKIMQPGRAYKVEIQSTETYQETHIKSTKYTVVTDFTTGQFPNLNLLYTAGEDNKAAVGKEHTLSLGTSDDELDVYYQILRGQELIKSGFLQLNEENTISYTPEEKDRGGYSVTLDYVKHNYSQQKVINIALPWDNKKLNLELLTLRDKVLPEAKEEWQLKISGNDANQWTAEVLATMYDASLDQFVPHAYQFHPYPLNYTHLRSRFFGFGRGITGSLNAQWSRRQTGRREKPIIPMLQGVDLGYRYAGMNTMAGSADGSIRVRGGAPVISEEMEMAPMAAKIGDVADADNAILLENASTQDEGTTKEMEPPKEISVRRNLDELVFFYPHLKTDAEGNTIVSFTMNEALTRWKFQAFAHDKALRYGITSHEVKTQKDLMILPNAPRFLREGDQLVFPATVSNLSETPITAKATLQLLDPVTDKMLNEQFALKSSDTVIKIPVGESKRVDWTIQVPKDYKGLVKYRVLAEAGSHTDGEENLLPVVTNQTLVTETKVISLKKQEEKTFTFDAIGKTATATSIPFRYTLEYTSNPVWYAVQALPYLMEYPHNCTEQIFNRMYANTLASHIANQSPKIKQIFDQWKAFGSDALMSNLEKNESLKSAILEETPWVRQAKSETEQKKRIALLFDFNKMSSETKQVLDELRKRQLPNGAFPWFSGGRADVFITQNIVEGIAHLQHLGVITAQDYDYQGIVDKALIYLDEESKKRYDELVFASSQSQSQLSADHLSPIAIHYLYIRSFFKDKKINASAEKAYNYYMSQAEKHWLGKGLYAEAMLGLVLHRAGNKTYQDVRASLKERSFYSEELGRYWNMGNGFNWYELPIESHAMLIEFFVEIDENRSFIEDMKIWLLKNNQTNHWQTTKSTAAAIYALLVQGEKQGMTSWVEENNVPEVMIGGKELVISENQLEAGTGYLKKIWNGDEISKDLKEIKITNNNQTISWGAAYYQYFEDLDKVESFRDTPLKIKRQLFKEIKTDRDPELVELDDHGDLKPGDRIIVRIELKVDRSMSYVHLKDMRGSGFEPENVLSGYRWKSGLGYYESTRDLASHFFISHLRKGTYVFEYPVRVVHRGDFSTGIATIQCMYAPEFTSHSEGGRVVVK